jgi:hypothetical protein
MLTAITMMVLAVPVLAQPGAKPGPEHDVIKRLEGNWTILMKAGGMEYKGTMAYKMELGGLWLVGSMESDFGEGKFTGKSLDTYDAAKKKYLTVWVDSMSTTPIFMEGTYDAKTKTLTMTGEAPDMEGKLAKWKSVTEYPDNDTVNFTMYLADAKEPMFSIVYKRKK